LRVDANTVAAFAITAPATLCTAVISVVATLALRPRSLHEI
jgi:hypothetical protein